MDREACEARVLRASECQLEHLEVELLLDVARRVRLCRLMSGLDLALRSARPDRVFVVDADLDTGLFAVVACNEELRVVAVAMEVIFGVEEVEELSQTVACRCH